MKHSALVLAVFAVMAASVPAAAQNAAPAPPASEPGRGPGLIGGAVVSSTGEPLAASTVAVRRDADSAVVATVVAGADGRFHVRAVAPGRYTLVATHLGYETARTHVAVTADASVDVGSIKLATSPIAMQAIQVEARRSPVVMQPDRSAYAVKDMPVASGGMASDVLRHIPEVEVDVNGKPSLRGSQGVTVQINGRPAPVRGDDIGQFLQSFPANRIDRIEVIPNPSAKFDAEGTGGIINIVLKQGADLGLSGSVTATGGNRTNGLAGRLAYQKGRFTIFGGTSGNLAHMQNNSSDLRVNLLTEPLTSLHQNAAGGNHNHSGMLDLSTEYKLSPRSTLWLAGTTFRFGANGSNLTDYLLLDSSAIALQRFDRGNVNHFDGNSADLSLGFKRVVQPQRNELSVELRSTRFGMHQDVRSTQDLFGVGGAASSPGTMSVNDVHHVLNELSLQADYSHPLGKKGKLEAGTRLSSRPVDYDNQLQLFASPSAPAPEQAQDGSWRHRATVNAVYGTITRPIGRLSLQAGLRGEASTSSFRVPATGERFDYSYRNLFPSAALSYDLKGGRELKLAYSRRIDRPFPMYMNPYVPSVDPLNRIVGNPFLQPKYTHSLTMDMSWTMTQGSVRLSPYYRETLDNWDQIKEADSLGVGWLTWKNLARVQAYGTTVTGSLRQWGPVSGFLSLGAYREVRDASNVASTFSGSSIRFSANTSATIKVNHDLEAQVQANYQPPRDIPQGRVSAMVMSSIGAKQKIRGTQATLNASVIDPFNLWHYDFHTSDETHVQTSHNAFTMRRATLGITYTFGKTPQQVAKRKPADDPQAATAPDGPIH